MLTPSYQAPSSSSSSSSSHSSVDSPTNQVPQKAAASGRRDRYASKACTLCAFSKLKCDNALPCSRCVRKGQSHLCVKGTKKKRRQPADSIMTMEDSDSGKKYLGIVRFKSDEDNSSTTSSFLSNSTFADGSSSRDLQIMTVGSSQVSKHYELLRVMGSSSVHRGISSSFDFMYLIKTMYEDCSPMTHLRMLQAPEEVWNGFMDQLKCCLSSYELHTLQGLIVQNALSITNDPALELAFKERMHKNALIPLPAWNLNFKEMKTSIDVWLPEETHEPLKYLFQVDSLDSDKLGCMIIIKKKGSNATKVLSEVLLSSYFIEHSGYSLEELWQNSTDYVFSSPKESFFLEWTIPAYQLRRSKVYSVASLWVQGQSKWVGFNVSVKSKTGAMRQFFCIHIMCRSSPNQAANDNSFSMMTICKEISEDFNPLYYEQADRIKHLPLITVPDI